MPVKHTQKAAVVASPEAAKAALQVLEFAAG
jgi:hypothetical protein